MTFYDISIIREYFHKRVDADAEIPELIDLLKLYTGVDAVIYESSTMTLIRMAVDAAKSYSIYDEEYRQNNDRRLINMILDDSRFDCHHTTIIRIFNDCHVIL